MKNLKGPKGFFEAEAINIIRKELTENGMLATHPEEHHEKIINDFLIIGVYVHNLPVEASVIWDEYKNSIPAAYFTLIKLSSYQLDIEDFIKAFQRNFKSFLDESPMGPIIKAMVVINVDDPEMVSLVKNVLEENTLDFLEKYSTEKWSDAIQAINNLSEEELQALLETDGIKKDEI